MTNLEYIRSLDDKGILNDKGILAFWNVAVGGSGDIFCETCNLCRYGGVDRCMQAAETGHGKDVVRECDKATWRWLHDQTCALKKAVEEELHHESKSL